MKAAAKKDADGTYLLNGQKVMIPIIYKSTDNMMIQMLRQKNAGYASEEGMTALKHWKPLQYSKKLPRKKQRKSATEMEGKSGG